MVVNVGGQSVVVVYDGYLFVTGDGNFSFHLTIMM